MSSGRGSLVIEDLLELHSLSSSLLFSLLRLEGGAGARAKGLSGGRLAGPGVCRKAGGTVTAADRAL